jgi:Leucine-rich repeat (LRR) protein
MTPDQDHPSEQASLSDSDELANQVAQLIRLVRSGEEANIKLALLLAKSLGNPAAFQQYLEGLLPLYHLAFKRKRKKWDATSLTKLFQLTELDIQHRYLTRLPESLGQLQNLQELDCEHNQLQALPERLVFYQGLVDGYFE